MKAIRKHSITSGALLTISMRWSDRLIGLVSTLILARLLVPDDFGVIAMASLAIGMASVLLDFGVNIALIQNQQATQAHYDSAWTLRLLQAAAVTVILILLSPWAADYFDDARVEPVLQVLAFSVLLNGFENIGTVAFQKNMQFGAEFRFLFAKRMAGFITTIVAALVLRSYWALVIGTLVGRGFGVGLSYMMHSMRPRLSFAKMADIFSVSQWMLLKSIGEYLRKSAHRILVGHWFPTSTMGAYTLASEISSMPTTELLAPLNRVLFPAFSETKENLQQLKRLFLLAQGVQTLIVIPMAVGLALVAEEAIHILLGEKWLMAVPFVEVLVLGNIAQSIGTSSSYLLIVLGKFKASAMAVWIQVVIFIALAVSTMQESSVIDIAWLRVVIEGVGIGVLFYLVIRALPLVTVKDLVRSTIRPLLGAAVMSLVLFEVSANLELSLWAMLCIKVMLGAVIYMVVVLSLWLAWGRPDGAEQYLLNKLQFNLTRKAAR